MEKGILPIINMYITEIAGLIHSSGILVEGILGEPK